MNKTPDEWSEEILKEVFSLDERGIRRSYTEMKRDISRIVSRIQLLQEKDTEWDSDCFSGGR